MVEITDKQLFISCLAISRVIDEFDETYISAVFDCSSAELENLLEEMDQIAIQQAKKYEAPISSD